MSFKCKKATATGDTDTDKKKPVPRRLARRFAVCARTEIYECHQRRTQMAVSLLHRRNKRERAAGRPAQDLSAATHGFAAEPILAIDKYNNVRRNTWGG